MQQNQPKIPAAVSPYVASRKACPVRQEALYEEFILWSAMTTPQRRQEGVETQKDFALRNGLSERTLNRWRGIPAYKVRVREIWDRWAFGKTSNVIHAIYMSAMKGNAQSQSLWMQLFYGFDPRSKKKGNEEKTVEFTVNDVRFLIEQLPADRKQTYYGFLRDLYHEVDQVTEFRDVEITEEFSP